MAFLSAELSVGELTLLLFPIVFVPADNLAALRREQTPTTWRLDHGQKSVNAKCE